MHATSLSLSTTPPLSLASCLSQMFLVSLSEEERAGKELLLASYKHEL